MRIAFLNCGLQSQLATKYLVEEHGFKAFSIMQLLEDIKDQYFKQINDENFLYMLKLSYEKLDKYLLIRDIINKANGTLNIVISDISNITEYYSILMEDFVPVKIDTQEIYFDSILTTVPMLRISSEQNLNHFYENIDVLINNYDVLEQSKTKGGVIKYVDEKQED